MPEEKIYLSKKLRQQMLEHARCEMPFEACGIVGGQDRRALNYYPSHNDLQSLTSYNIAPEDLFRIMMELEDKGHELWGIFHSHPATDPYPSERDIKQSYYPETYYLIASFINYTEPELRAFRINEGAVEEVEIMLV